MAQTVKKFAYNGGDLGSIPGLGRSPGEGNSYLLHPVFLPREFHEQRSLEGYSPWSHKQSDMAERLSHTYTHTHTACPSLCKQTSGKLSAVKLFWMCHFAFKSNWRQFFLNVYGTQVIYIYTQDYILTLTYLFFLILPSHWATLNLEQPETSTKAKMFALISSILRMVPTEQCYKCIFSYS